MSASTRSYPFIWIVILALLTALGPLSIDMYLPALTVIAQDLSVPTAWVASSIPAYFLGLVVGQLIYGPISDRIGRKTPLYAGLALFSLASLLCATVQSIDMLIVARVVQALGGCVGVVIARAAIRDRLNPAESSEAFSLLMLVVGVAPILAPLFGSFVLTLAGWRGIFYSLAVVGVITMVLIHYYFEETLIPAERRQLNLSQVFATYWDLLKDHRFRTPALAGGLLIAAMFSYISSATELFVEHFGMSAHGFAWLFGINAAGLIFLSQVNGRLVKKLGLLTLLHIGACMQVFGVVLLLLLGVTGHNTIFTTMLGLFFVVSAIGFTSPNAMAIALSSQGHRAGMASALLGAIQFALGLLAGLAVNLLPFALPLSMSLVMLVVVGLGSIAVLVLRWRERRLLVLVPPPEL